MKQMIMAACLCAASICTQAQEKEEVVAQFKASPEFERVQQQFKELGEADFGEATVNFVEANGRHPYGNLYFRRDGQITAVLEFVHLPEKAGKLLPNNDRFAMQLVDYRNFESENLTGTIRAYDLNYDNHQAALLEVQKGMVTGLKTFSIPDELIKKYAGLDPAEQTGDTYERKAHFCDGNGNGNISYSECYRCMVKACKGNPECDLLCNLINQASGYTPIPKQCNLSFVASCIIISIFM